MLKWLASFLICAMLVPEISPEAVRAVSAALASLLFVLTPPVFFTGVMLALFQRTDL